MNKNSPKETQTKPLPPKKSLPKLVKKSTKADTNKNNGLSFVFNQFDEASVNSFNQECCKLLGLEPNK
jgi:hypothetical protein